MTTQTLSLFVTEAHPCSYLAGEEAQTAFLDPDIPLNQELVSILNRQGFRRSGRFLYRNACKQCHACQPLRVDTTLFKPKRSDRRLQKRNADLCIRMTDTPDLDAYYPLYEQYIRLRHSDGDMYPPSRNQFEDFIGHTLNFTRIMEISLEGKPVSVAVFDFLTDGLSAIYTFFDPNLSERSLGVYSILKQIEIAQSAGLPYVYLGFWIRDCQKMNYKTRFAPHQIFDGKIWR